MNRSIWLVGVVLFLGAILGCRAALTVDETKCTEGILLRNVHVLDVAEGRMSDPLDVLVIEDRIALVGACGTLGHATVEIDGGGRYLLPGLFDCHTHIAHVSTMEAEEMADALHAFVAAGITQVRDVGGPVDVLHELSAGTESDVVSGPEIFFTGPMLEASPLTWGDQNEEMPGFTVAIDSVEDVDRVLPELASAGACMVKTFNKFDRDVYAHLLEVARAHGLRVVHDPGDPLFHQVPMDVAVDLGVTSIEHAKSPWPVVLIDELRERNDALVGSDAAPMARMAVVRQASELGVDSIDPARLAALAEQMVRHDAYLCPTLQVSKHFEENPPWEGQPEPVQEMMKKVLGAMDQVSLYCTREMAAKGVKLLVGQDGIHPEGTLREIAMLRDCGVSEAEILRGATLYPAQWLGVDDRLGSIRIGLEATLLVVDEDPLEDVERLRSPWLVLRRGEIAFRNDPGGE